MPLRPPNLLLLLCLLGLLVKVSIATDYEDEKESPTGRGFNETCDYGSSHACISELHCNYHLRRCLCSPSDLTYDAGKGKCVHLLNAYCRSYYSSSYLQCVSGAECGAGGVCKCLPGSIPDSSRTRCISRRELNQTCSPLSEDKCNEHKLLTCLEGTCQCDLNISTPTNDPFDDSSHLKSGDDDSGHTVEVIAVPCLGRIGSPCSSNSKVCPTTAVCHKGVCSCPNFLPPNENGVCTLSHGEECDPLNFLEAPCNSKFRCTGTFVRETYDTVDTVSRKCSCPNPTLEVYDSNSGSCIRLVGSPCNLSEGNPSCVSKASCVARGDTFLCKCDEGYVATIDGKCQLAYGSSCNYSTSYSSSISTEFCDEEAFLVCIDGTCTCPNSLAIFEKTRKRCVFPVGVACKESADCVNNADCLSDVADDNRLPRLCTCKSGFTKATKGTCGPQ